MGKLLKLESARRSRKKAWRPAKTGPSAPVSSPTDSLHFASTNCAILAIDPGKKSGAALFINGEFQDAWQVSEKAAERQDVVCHAMHEAIEHEVDLCAAIERWPYFGGVRTALGLGEASGRWKEQLELKGLPKRRIVGIDVNAWRKGVFGHVHDRHGTEGWKANAVQLCRVRFNKTLQSDAAEAACLGLYATKCREVLRVLPKRRGGVGSADV